MLKCFPVRPVVSRHKSAAKPYALSVRNLGRSTQYPFEGASLRSRVSHTRCLANGARTHDDSSKPLLPGSTRFQHAARLGSLPTSVVSLTEGRTALESRNANRSTTSGNEHHKLSLGIQGKDRSRA